MPALITLLAQGTERTQEAPSTGPGIALIIGTILLILLVLALVFFFIARTTKASHGGVETAPGSRTSKGDPPFESIEREVEKPHEP
jgi:hypothetical protein